MYCDVLYCNVLYFIVLYCNVLYFIVLYCNVLFCIVTPVSKDVFGKLIEIVSWKPTGHSFLTTLLLIFSTSKLNKKNNL